MTFLGDHTINETLDLIKAKDITIEDMLKARTELGRQPDDTWDSDYAALDNRYKAAKIAFQAERAVVQGATLGVSDDIRTTETAYNAILRAVRRDPNVENKGDLIDLWRRATTAKGSAIPTRLNAIQPDSDTKDIDLNIFNKLDKLPIPKNSSEFKKAAMYAGGGIAGLLLLKFLLK